MQTFRSEPKRLAMPWGFVALFTLWIGLAIIALRTDTTYGRPTFFQLAMIIGVPAVMLALSLYLLVLLYLVVELDPGLLVLRTGFGAREVQASDVAGYSISELPRRQVQLFLRTGKSVDIPLWVLSREASDSILAWVRQLRTDPLDTVVCRLTSRYVLAIVVGLVLGLMWAAVPSMAGSDRGTFFGLLLILTAVLGSIVVYGLSFRATLLGGGLTIQSAFGTRTYDLKHLSSAVISVRKNREGRHEVLTLDNGKRKVYLTDNIERYSMLRDAILAELPPGQLEDRRAPILDA